MTKKSPTCRHCPTVALAAFGTLFFFNGSLAQPGPPATPPQGQPETVVVTAHRTQQEIDAIVSQFVDLHTAANRKTGQYMRDDIGPVCPVTLGLPQSFDDFVTARIVQVAASVGAQTERRGSASPTSKYFSPMSRKPL
ncbi:MAG TPA: hypothetical protein VHT03_14530 [Rhizomicrobium sp.]|jgi:hypothetical protein|nr:hypothetical protein [Rhizomicrobium sp.]